MQNHSSSLPKINECSQKKIDIIIWVCFSDFPLEHSRGRYWNSDRDKKWFEFKALVKLIFQTGKKAISFLISY